jgi:hypothetical protein
MSVRKRSEAFSSTSSSEGGKRACTEEFDKDSTINETPEKIMEDIMKTFVDKMEKQMCDFIARLEEKWTVFEQKQTEKLNNVIEEQTKQNERIKKLEDQLEKQQELTVQLEQEILTARRHAIRNEQYTRKYNIRIFGVKEEKDEDCKEAVLNIVRNNMHLDIAEVKIAIAHRIHSAGRDRPIIVRLTDTETRRNIPHHRRVLKGTRVTIGEDLCRDLVTTLNRAKQHPHISQAWSKHGRIYVMDKQQTVTTLEWGESVIDALTTAKE